MRSTYLRTFRRIFRRNLDRFSDQRDALLEAGLLNRGHYVGNVQICLHDVSSGPVQMTAEKAQLLITSPPYGDNATTVPYGQHAYLPLQWIDLADIDSHAGTQFLASTHAIDSMCLGAPTRGALEQVTVLRAVSPTLDATLDSLAPQPRDRALRVAAFWRDLNESLDHILSSLAPGALMAWTVGNRRVGGLQVPMDKILHELLTHRGCHRITTLSRAIPDNRKRMASRNSVAATMNAEQVLVLRRSTD